MDSASRTEKGLKPRFLMASRRWLLWVKTYSYKEINGTTTLSSLTQERACRSLCGLKSYWIKREFKRYKVWLLLQFESRAAQLSLSGTRSVIHKLPLVSQTVSFVHIWFQYQGNDAKMGVFITSVWWRHNGYIHLLCTVIHVPLSTACNYTQHLELIVLK